jgi:alpha-L-fucosidase
VGFNYYIGDDIWHSACCPHKGALLPAGDAHIVYPGPDGKPYRSMRFEAQLGGAEDYELLMQLIERSPEKADHLIQSVCTSFSRYNKDGAAVKAARLELFKLLEEVSHMSNLQWFRDARFVMFIHWGLYALPAKGEWYASIDRVPTDRYEQYFHTFDPVDYDPRRWARLAKEAGMKYAVLTAKHHEGFCLFDSAYTDYSSVHTPAGRDLVREYVDAFRAEGLGVGLYYSLVDWHHPDYPAYQDPFHPMRESDAKRNESCDFDRYLDYMHAQVRELCSNYGKLDLLWFDFSYEGHTGPDWRAQELVDMVRKLQPGILINSRLEASGGALGSLLTDSPTAWAGDFATPEQILPPGPLCRPDGTKVPWEACQTMNNSFGYTAADRNFKSAKTLIH